MDPIVLIPAYQPKAELPVLNRRLLSLGVSSILVVNDGSGAEYREIFDELEEMKSVEVIHHKFNQGKGAALRTGFRHIMKNHPDALGIVTMDADGQHLPEDVYKVYLSLSSHRGALILGSRSFSEETPARCAFGNYCTRFFFHLFTGMRVTDTQTGLRGIPSGAAPLLADLTSERYEYELDMLLTLRDKEYPIMETSIETVYENKNESSHFRPVADSFRIYSLLFTWLFKVRLSGLFK